MIAATTPTCPTCKGEMFWEKPLWYCAAASEAECLDSTEYQLCDGCEQLVDRDLIRNDHWCVDCLSRGRSHMQAVREHEGDESL